MENTTITKLPNVPEEIKEAVNDGNLVVFIGAGVSRIIGCEGWDELANNLVEACYNTFEEGSNNPILNFHQKETLKKEADNIKKITICHFLLNKNEQKEVFYSIFDKALECNSDLKSKYDIYKEIYSFNGINISTNADIIFDDSFNENDIIVNFDQFDTEVQLYPKQLYKIHGTQYQRETLVFITSQYFKKYKNEGFKTFLRKIFNEKYKILFIGYGLSEFELLDYIIPKFAKEIENPFNYYSLMPYYSHEAYKYEYDQTYFNTLGIKIIPYEIDDIGYSQLYKVVKYWSSEIHQISDLIFKNREKIDTLLKLNHLSKEKKEEILRLINGDSINESYFFDKLSKVEHPELFFDLLNINNYFKKYKIPGIDFYKDGSYKAIPWNATDYLTNLAKKNYLTPTKNVSKGLLDIIDDISLELDDKNYLITNFLIEIIFLLPKENLSDKHLNYFEDKIENNQNSIMISVKTEKIIERLIKDRNIDILYRFCTIILGFNIKQKEYNQLVPKIRIYYLSSIIKKHSTKIIELLNPKLLTPLSDFFCESIDFQIHFDFINSSFDDILEDNSSNLTDNYSYQILRLLLNCLISVEVSVGKRYLTKYINSENSILNKIAIFIISKKYVEYNDIFWSCKINLFEKYQLNLDLYNLIEQKCEIFGEDNIEDLIIRVNNSYKKYGNRSDIIYIKKTFIYACLKIKNTQINSQFDRYNSINKKEVIDPSSKVSSKIKKERDYKNSNKLYELDIEDLINYLNNYKSEEFPYIGIEYQFKKLIVNNPQKYLNYPEKMIDLNYRYIKNIFYAYYDVLIEGSIKLDWVLLLQFITNVINKKSFWINCISNTKNTIIRYISDIIKIGLDNKDSTYTKNNYLSIEKIILLLVKKEFNDYNKEIDIIASVIKSNYGCIYNVILAFLLKKGRVLESEGGNQTQIPNKFKTIFDKILSKRNDKSFLLKLFISMHLDNFLLFLDKEWTITNIDIIFPIEQESILNPSFECYFLSHSHFYPEIYKIFKSKEYLNKGIEKKFKNQRAFNSFVQHICFGYFYKIEDLSEDSLFIQVLNSLSSDQMFKFNSFLSMIKIDRNYKEQIKPLWKAIYVILNKSINNQDFKNAIAESIKFLKIIDLIDDEILEYVMFAIKYIDEDILYFIPEILLQHVFKTPIFVGNIYLELLDNKHFIIYPKEKVKELFLEVNKNDNEQGHRIKALYAINNNGTLDDL